LFFRSHQSGFVVLFASNHSPIAVVQAFDHSEFQLYEIPQLSLAKDCDAVQKASGFFVFLAMVDNSDHVMV